MPFSVRGWLRFWAVFEQFARALPLRFPVLSRGLRELVSGWPRLCQSCAKGFFLQDSDVAFSVRSGLRFGCVFGRFARAVPLRFPVSGRALRELFSGCPRLCQSCAKGFFLQDSDVAFRSAAGLVLGAFFGDATCLVGTGQQAARGRRHPGASPLNNI